MDSINTDHVYDSVQQHKCDYARDKYDTVGPERRANSDPNTWNLLKGLIGICLAVQGDESEWETVVDSYRDVRGISTGNCKYEAGYRLLEAVASFVQAHPDGKVLIDDAPTGPGSAACPYRIQDVYVSATGRSPETVAPGTELWARGTWPSEVGRVLLNGTEAPVIRLPDSDQHSCCHNASVSFTVPENMPKGTVNEVTVTGAGFRISARITFEVQ
ncbi:hypothetical protein [Streptomyces sp. NRRL S-481]|uniref:hypothetical protein n=1 Tax=Streptomyces sp. NRRL S-481 TaxID=1463911 RepID=UPI0004C64807|nr:hypothetical protein [Streptomyces sp. NRRL S-481]